MNYSVTKQCLTGIDQPVGWMPSNPALEPETGPLSDGQKRAFLELNKVNSIVSEKIIAQVYTEALQDCGDFVAVDGGAHAAFHTLHICKIPNCRKVYAVEADPDIFKKLTYMVNLSSHRDKCALFELAIQDDFYVKSLDFMCSTSHPGRSGIHSIWTEDPQVEFKSVTVKASTIDQIIADRPSPLGLIKLDLEGGEFPALRGGRKAIMEDRPIIIMEHSVRAPSINGYTMKAFYAYFESIGYQALTFFGDLMDSSNDTLFHDHWLAPHDRVPFLQDMIRHVFSKTL